jgi:hypothetical protein
MPYLRILIPLAFVAGSTRCPAATENDSTWLRGRPRATARAKPTAEHGVIVRYAGWRWCDLTERMLNDELTGQSHRSFLPWVGQDD